ncbi:hypothetical protein MMH89_04250 [Candidatus Comchoanobacter bicostacola]|uniref:Guanylate kinase-like domain-containing protein n=1 Tax=Candidatus Comchoanobacter bicostacola TaxID=2919598 RepID=A0ABY5DKL3_9GAMM|nr:hypothetical protein [Candidatus Comchoanobacter bicostacola]UTC24429.1 hypothetical protein MMH89_04250 [Candidatus Comchoanobacter bicostacola]
MKNRLLVITGPSGVGKTVLANHLVEELGIKRCVTCTSRLPRKFEKDGVDYFFLSKLDFEALIQSNRFVEFNEHYGTFYGLRSADLESLLLKSPVLLVMNWEGAKKLEAQYNADVVFIEPKDISVLSKRLVKRSGNDDRIRYAESDLAQAKQFSCRLVNDDLQTAKQDITTWAQSKIG